MKPASTSLFVVGGIVFLGAGTISLWREVVCGLAPAACQRGREALEKAYPEEKHE